MQSFVEEVKRFNLVIEWLFISGSTHNQPSMLQQVAAFQSRYRVAFHFRVGANYVETGLAYLAFQSRYRVAFHFRIRQRLY